MLSAYFRLLIHTLEQHQRTAALRCRNTILSGNCQEVKMQYLPEGSRLHTPENQAALRSVASMERAMHAGTILEARAVLCDSGHKSQSHRTAALYAGLDPQRRRSHGYHRRHHQGHCSDRPCRKTSLFPDPPHQSGRNWCSCGDSVPPCRTGRMLGAVPLPPPRRRYSATPR